MMNELGADKEFLNALRGAMARAGLTLISKEALLDIQNNSFLIKGAKRTQQTLNNLLKGGWVSGETAIIIEHELANIASDIARAKGDV